MSGAVGGEGGENNAENDGKTEVLF